MKTFPGIVQLAYSALTYPNSISIGNHMILSAIIREKACITHNRRIVAKK